VYFETHMSDMTRDRILDAAALILRMSGSAGITMEATADAAGVSRKTVYNHFSNRYVLMDSVMARGVGRVVSSLEAVANDDSLDFITKLNTITASGFEQIQSGRKMFLRPAAAGLEAGLPDVYREIREILLEFIGGIVREAAREGVIKADIDTAKFTYVLINIVEGLVLNEDSETEPYSRLEILKLSLRTVLSGILTPLGSEALKDSPIFG